MTLPRGGAVAIIGMSCRTAGAETPAELWDLLLAGRRCFTEVPADRWYGLDPGPAVPKPPRAALLDRIDEFDARFFGIAGRMAAWMEPQHRMMLELASQAVEDACLDLGTLEGEAIAVFVGSFLSDYRERMHARRKSDGAAFPGTLTAFHANRVSYQFGWTGPSMVIDSACSSSLSAVGLAIQGLRDGEYPMALVGAPSVISSGLYANTAYRSGALSPTGDSVPFDVSRDGYVRGEGGACVLLKMLDRALIDGDPIRAVIRAVGNAHNGRGGGLTGSDATAQVRLVRDTARAAGCVVGELGHVEAHGTGTPGGDEAEIAALAEALRTEPGVATSAGPEEKLWVGSIKANIGHLEGAAGLIGLVKTVLMLRHGRIPRIAGLDRVDPRLAFGDVPLAFAEREVPWPAGNKPRRAAVNSFGLGGTMSHAIIEEHVAATPPGDPDGVYVVPLSAGSERSLEVLATRLAAEMEGEAPPRLADVAWTMQSVRRPQRVRGVVLARDRAELRTGLRNVTVTGGAIGVSGPHPVADAAARDWMHGRAVDWRALWTAPAITPVRVHLPTTPFDRRSYWFEDLKGAGISG